MFDKISMLLQNVATYIQRLFNFKRKTGRKVEFDERSRNYPVDLSEVPEFLQAQVWARHIPVLNQRKTLACTGFATVACLGHTPVFNNNAKQLTNKLGLEIYSQATKIDPFPGEYPPDDTGSTVLSAVKSAKSAGLISEYRWCFGISDVLRTLAHIGPVVVGLEWYEGFNHPDRNGYVSMDGSRDGAHAFVLTGIDPNRKLVRALNSWGPMWGLAGEFYMSFDDLEHLLRRRGEAVYLVSPRRPYLA